MIVFHGTELGSVREIVEQLKTFIPKPPYAPKGDIDYLGWVNTQIPEYILLDVYNDVVYINLYLFNDFDPSTLRQKREEMREQSKTLLKQLGLDFRPVERFEISENL